MFANDKMICRNNLSIAPFESQWLANTSSLSYMIMSPNGLLNIAWRIATQQKLWLYSRNERVT